MKPVRTQVGHSTLSLSNLSTILPRMLKRLEVGPVTLGEAPNFVQEMKRICRTFSDAYNYMRRHQLKFGYGPKYLSLEVAVRPAEPGTVSNSCHKTLKTGTDTQIYLNKVSVENQTPNENKTNTFKVKQLTPIQNEVTELTPMQNEVTELTPIQINVRELTPLYTSDTEGPEATTDSGLLILGTTQYDDDEADPSGKCQLVEGKFKGKFKSPNADTVPITNSHISDTASNSHKSLTADSDFNTNNNPINGLITFKPKTLPLAHTSNQSLITYTDYTKTHHTKSCYFTYWKRKIPFSPKKRMNKKYLFDNFCHLIII